VVFFGGVKLLFVQDDLERIAKEKEQKKKLEEMKAKAAGKGPLGTCSCVGWCGADRPCVCDSHWWHQKVGQVKRSVRSLASFSFCRMYACSAAIQLADLFGCEGWRTQMNTKKKKSLFFPFYAVFFSYIHGIVIGGGAGFRRRRRAPFGLVLSKVVCVVVGLLFYLFYLFLPCEKSRRRNRGNALPLAAREQDVRPSPCRPPRSGRSCL